MRKQVAVLAEVLCVAAATLPAADKSSDANWQTYVDSTYKVVLRSPPDLISGRPSSREITTGLIDRLCATW